MQGIRSSIIINDCLMGPRMEAPTPEPSTCHPERLSESLIEQPPLSPLSAPPLRAFAQHHRDDICAVTIHSDSGCWDSSRRHLTPSLRHRAPLAHSRRPGRLQSHAARLGYCPSASALHPRDAPSLAPRQSPDPSHESRRPIADTKARESYWRTARLTRLMSRSGAADLEVLVDDSRADNAKTA